MKRITVLLSTTFLLFFSQMSFGQIVYPGGDTCSSSFPISVGLFFSTPADGCEEDFDHWYTFIAPCDGALSVSNCGYPNKSERRIFTGSCDDLTLQAAATWSDTCRVSHELMAGELATIQVNDSWDCVTQFDIEFIPEGVCEDIDSFDLDIEGHVYFDMNENGMRDFDEVGASLVPMRSSPDGLFIYTLDNGFYYSSVFGLDDGVYEIYPETNDYWRITSDSLVYTINVDDDYEQRDSLDFGIYPDTLIYELTSDIIGGFPRCNDTINYWLRFQNTGTTIASGIVHLELDDSLSYVSADILPDSIVDQNLYWSFEDLFYEEIGLINVSVATPDGVADTVSSTYRLTIDSADVEMYAASEVFEQIITCAYDPNDKTPIPLGEGEFGNIDPDTESIEYLIRFQNTGTDTAFTVVIKDQLDENLDWYSLTPLSYSHDMQIELDMDGEVSFIFEDIMLPDSNVNFLGSQGFVKYSIDLKPDLPIGTSIFNTANIYFDLNPAIVTNTTINTLFMENSGIDELGNKEQLLVYPNPFTEKTTVYFEKDLKYKSIQIVDMLGNKVYFNDQLNGNKLEIDAAHFEKGMYVLILVDNESNQVLNNAKLIVN
jgi:uncharacterized repeat protein (TIGR01451 family)